MKILRLLPFSLVLCTTPLLAAELEDEFRALDLNGDGLVSQAEAAGNAEIVTKFDRADRNRDGKLSFAEFQRLKKLKTRAAAKNRDKGSATGATTRRSPGKASD